MNTHSDSQQCAFGTAPERRDFVPWGPCTTPERKAVIWDDRGRGACGKHQWPLAKGVKP